MARHYNVQLMTPEYFLANHCGPGTLVVNPARMHVAGAKLYGHRSKIDQTEHIRPQMYQRYNFGRGKTVLEVVCPIDSCIELESRTKKGIQDLAGMLNLPIDAIMEKIN
jgi:hypothetical protein